MSTQLPEEIENAVKRHIEPPESKAGNNFIELSESEQDTTMVPIVHPEVNPNASRSKKNSSKDHPHTLPVTSASFSR